MGSAEDIAEVLDELTRFVIRQTGGLGELSLTAASTLSTLARTGPRRLTELAGAQGVSQPSMTVMVSRLEKQGLVTRRRDEQDRRIVLVGVTDDGRELLRRRQSARLAFLASLIGELRPAERAAIAGAADALHHMIEPAAVPAALDAARRAADDRPVTE